MKDLLDRTTVTIILSALFVALICILPSTRDVMPIRMISVGARIGDTFFHELGHTLFSWLFGQPAVPMIFTAFGSDQAGGMSLYTGRSWSVQMIAFFVLIYFCYWTKKELPGLFITAIIFSLSIFIISLTDYHKLVVAYMGHGGSILTGGFFLFRAWIYLDSRNQFERWLNAFFGFFLTLNNFYFSYGLAFNAMERGNYTSHTPFGVCHNDFYAMYTIIPALSVQVIAIFTMAYSITAIIGSLLLAIKLRNNFGEG